MTRLHPDFWSPDPSPSGWIDQSSAGKPAVGFLVWVDDGCTACGACLVTCPERALVVAPRRPATVAGRCTGCLACVEICPRDALTVEASG